MTNRLHVISVYYSKTKLKGVLFHIHLQFLSKNLLVFLKLILYIISPSSKKDKNLIIFVVIEQSLFIFDISSFRRIRYFG